MIKHQFAIGLEVGRLASAVFEAKREADSGLAKDESRHNSRRTMDAAPKIDLPLPDGEAVF